MNILAQTPMCACECLRRIKFQRQNVNSKSQSVLQKVESIYPLIASVQEHL
jgi:hypothetical protein